MNSFIGLHRGWHDFHLHHRWFNAAELPPKYPDFISERVYALHAAARWWYEYRQDALLLNNV